MSFGIVVKETSCLNKHTGLRNPLHPCIWDARKWRENEEMERDSLSTFPHSLFISSLSINFLYQNFLYHILSQNVKYGTFVENVTKKHTYAL